jgi:hypothetical protein
MLRIGLSGTNWTGKTMTIRAFCDAHANRRIEAVSLSDYVARCPYPMEREQIPDASRWMYEQVRERLEQPSDADVQLFDRTPLDILAFTRYAYDRLQQPVDSDLVSAIHSLLAFFNRVYLVSPSEEWPVGVAPSPERIAFALLMDWYLRQTIRGSVIPVIHLPWAMEIRQAKLCEQLTA